jgi:hypothetical protein
VRGLEEEDQMPGSSQHETPRPDAESVPRTPQNPVPAEDDQTEEEARLRTGGFRHDHTAEPAEPGDEQIHSKDAATRADR